MYCAYTCTYIYYNIYLIEVAFFDELIYIDIYCSFETDSCKYDKSDAFGRAVLKIKS